MNAGETLRWGPLTAVFLLASAWWVKWPLFAVLGGLVDARRRRVVPVAALTALAAAGIAGLVVSLLKDAAARPRPPLADPAIHAIGSVPDSTSFPSGHSATAFATAVAVGLLCPRLRLPLLALAAVVALSRVYLGVHYWSDVAAGSALGALIGLATGWVVLRARRSPRPPSPSPAAP
jgi:undecaprenyl-diphosphatase